MFGSIEAGGTKFVCAIGDEKLNILERIEIPTKTPEETLPKVIEFFQTHPVQALTVGSFGPIDVDEQSQNYGSIQATPKVAWKGFNYLEALATLNVPLYITTDVNAAAYGEYIADENIKSCTYFTVGTGVGAGYVKDGNIINGVNHPEMGHMIVKKHPEDTYPGYCIFHQDCLEGLACGPTIYERTKVEGQALPFDHVVFDYIAYYLAQAAYNITLIQSPEKIIFGGGVSQKTQLIEKVRTEFAKLMGGYIEIENLDTYITTPLLNNNAGTIGCLALAKSIV